MGHGRMAPSQTTTSDVSLQEPMVADPRASTMVLQPQAEMRFSCSGCALEGCTVLQQFRIGGFYACVCVLAVLAFFGGDYSAPGRVSPGVYASTYTSMPMSS